MKRCSSITFTIILATTPTTRITTSLPTTVVPKTTKTTAATIKTTTMTTTSSSFSRVTLTTFPTSKLHHQTVCPKEWLQFRQSCYYISSDQAIFSLSEVRFYHFIHDACYWQVCLKTFFEDVRSNDTYLELDFVRINSKTKNCNRHICNN